MKKGLLILGLVLGLSACTSTPTTTEDKVIKIASHMSPMTDVINVAKELLEEQGYTLELVQVSDNVQYNELLNHEEVDANFAQHQPYMERYNTEMNASLVAIAKIYNAKVGFYSKAYTTIDEIPNGATVALPNDSPNQGRALAMLAEQGLITLADGVGFNGVLSDITSNPKQLQWLEVDLLNLSSAYDEANVALVYNYPTYIAKLGLTPADAMFVEKTIDDRFAISLVVREDNQNDEKIQALLAAMTSDEVRNYLTENHSATLVPAF